KLDPPARVPPSSSASSQRTGRAKRMPESSQRIDFEKDSPRTIASTRCGSTSPSGRPGRSTPRKPSRTTRSSGPTPCFFAKPAAAFSASASGGPLIHSSGVCSATSSNSSASLRGPTKTFEGGAPTSRSPSAGSCASASRHAEAGSSSPPISSRNVGIGLQLEVDLCDLAREGANTADVGGPLGGGERAPRVEEVERMRRLQHLVVRRKRQPALKQQAALLLVLPEPPHQHIRRPAPAARA